MSCRLTAVLAWQLPRPSREINKTNKQTTQDFSAARIGAGEFLKVDGVSAPFEVAAFGPAAAALPSPGCPAVGAGDGLAAEPGHAGGYEAAAVAGSVFVFRRRAADAKAANDSAAVVRTIATAQALGAVACIVVNHEHEFFQPVAAIGDELAAARIDLPVLALPLTIGAGMLASHGALAVTFSYGGGDGGVAISPTAAPAAAGGDEARTVWVGGLPAAAVDAGGGSAVLAARFAEFGVVTGVTARLKTAKEGAPAAGGHRSWALLTFKESASATAALAAAAASPLELGHTGGAAAAVLAVRQAAVAEHLQMNEKRGAVGGALAAVWQTQQSKEREWLGSLYDGLNQDADYQAAKAEVAQRLGLRAEELEDELEEQQINALNGSDEPEESAVGFEAPDSAALASSHSFIPSAPPVNPRARPRPKPDYDPLDPLKTAEWV
eukprot:SAG22_NODE_2242_length_2801_cov_5.757957_1_plen_438_part_00